MIIKGQARGRSRQLATHLLRRDQNEQVSVYELRGVTADDLPGALSEMEALASAVHSKRPLYHASISPEAHTPFSHDQIRIAADTLERKLGLSGQPRAVVVHRKQGREHVHVVWSRIDVDRQRVIADSWSYRAHEQAARELEAAFGHRPVRGAHVPPSFAPRPRRATKDYECRQAERSGRPPAEVSAELAAIWQGSRDAQSFQKELEAAGYTLARGDRRVFVAIDRAGNVHSLARRLGVRSRELAARFDGLELAAMPSVSEVRNARHPARRSALRGSFRAAAKEIAAPPPPTPQPLSRQIRPSHAPKVRAAITWINEPQHAPASITRLINRRLFARHRYLTLRADVLAAFAAKIDAAYEREKGDALLAVLARLAEEREAALRTLEQLEGTGLSHATRRRPSQRRQRRRRLTLRRSKT